jgi:simple sugar transport system ATP-binding protein
VNGQREQSHRAPTLQLEHIVKDFGATRALEAAHLSVRSDTVHALLGENGAGKTSLMRIAFGLIQPDSGRILLDGREIHFRSPSGAIEAGIGMVHQHFMNVPAMTVAENIALGDHGLFSRDAAEGRVRALASETQLAIDPAAKTESLGVGAQQRVEILKALARGARLLIMDEPTAVLAPAEARELLGWLRAFADRGGAVILITHKLDEALAIADEVTVLRYGRTVLSCEAKSASAESLADAMLGAAAPKAGVVPASLPGEIVLRLSSLSIRDAREVLRVADVTLELRQREILGIAALENSGHELLLRVIAGRATPSSGTIERRGEPALIPEDRQRDALISEFSVAENIALKGAGRRRGRMDWPARRVIAERLSREFDVRAPSVDAPAGVLSGGNQQRLVLARELGDGPSVIVAENPTRGLDIRATAAVHTRLREAAAAGAAVVLYSSDLDEVLALATRVIAVHRGRLREVPNDREAAGRAMLGLS